MKKTLFIGSVIAAAFITATVATADHHKKDDHKEEAHAKHDHDHGDMQGPNGGRVLHEVDPHAELLVTEDRKIRISFLGLDGKAMKAGDEVISVICGKRTSPTRMKFEKGETSFLSDKPLPAGTNIPTVVQIRMKPDAKSEIIRLNLNLEDCPTCDFKEYACVCDHGHEHAHEKK